LVVVRGDALESEIALEDIEGARSTRDRGGPVTILVTTRTGTDVKLEGIGPKRRARDIVHCLEEQRAREGA
jgi:hypothetical protein